MVSFISASTTGVEMEPVCELQKKGIPRKRVIFFFNYYYFACVHRQSFMEASVAD